MTRRAKEFTTHWQGLSKGESCTLIPLFVVTTQQWRFNSSKVVAEMTLCTVHNAELHCTRMLTRIRRLAAQQETRAIATGRAIRQSRHSELVAGVNKLTLGKNSTWPSILGNGRRGQRLLFLKISCTDNYPWERIILRPHCYPSNQDYLVNYPWDRIARQLYSRHSWDRMVWTTVHGIGQYAELCGQWCNGICTVENSMG